MNYDWKPLNLVISKFVGGDCDPLYKECIDDKGKYCVRTWNECGKETSIWKHTIFHKWSSANMLKGDILVFTTIYKMLYQ